MIESEVSDYLDGIGNANGRYDVGDFVAWLDLLEGRAPAATVARDLEVTGATEEE
ncbi:MAG: hypothetical protein GWO04_14795, partial [Actinobacteria bacterium]|nr:hypothetical protein [Actinomycetota bacterium]